MAGLIFTAWTTGEIAISTTGEDIHLLLKAPANQGVIIKSWGLFNDGQTSTAAPILVRILKKTGTITGGVAGKKANRDGSSSMSVQTTVTSENTGGTSFTAQGTDDDLYGQFNVHAQTGHGEFWPLRQEILIEPGTTVVMTSKAGAVINCTAGFICEE